jgi:hypothetical protein
MPSVSHLTLLAQGRDRRVVALQGGSGHAALEAMGKERMTAARNIFMRAAQIWPPYGPERFEALGDDLYEIRSRCRSFSFVCFLQGPLVMLTDYYEEEAPRDVKRKRALDIKSRFDNHDKTLRI